MGVLVKGTELPSNTWACGVEGRYGVYTQIARYTNFITTTISGNTFTCDDCFTGSVRTSCTSSPAGIILKQEVTFPNVTMPRQWGGVLKKIYDVAYAMAIDVYSKGVAPRIRIQG